MRKRRHIVQQTILELFEPIPNQLASIQWRCRDVASREASGCEYHSQQHNAGNLSGVCGNSDKGRIAPGLRVAGRAGRAAGREVGIVTEVDARDAVA